MTCEKITKFEEQKNDNRGGWVQPQIVLGIAKSYVIIRVGQQKYYVCLQGGWVGQKMAQNMLT